MKITEIISEARGKLAKDVVTSTPGMKAYPQLDNGNVPYLQYRFGLALAASPHHMSNSSGPTGGQLLTLSYTDADEEIVQGASKAMGVSPTQRTNRQSGEVKSINKTSPVQARAPIALNKKKK